VLEKISTDKRLRVKEVTLDMARNMESAIKKIFPQAFIVIDRFHVVKLAMEALQHIRIDLRWKALDEENGAIAQAKKQGITYEPEVLSNGDTPKQLLARCRYILTKKTNQWTDSQRQRAALLFDRYPILKKAYEHAMWFRSIYEQKKRACCQNAI
jgi:transposase